MALETFRSALRGRFEVQTVDLEGIAIRDGEKYAWLYALGDLREEYEEGELDVVGIDRMHFFDLPYRSIAFLKRVLRAIADDPRVWVDLDNGMAVAGPELVARLQQEPEWLMGLPTVSGD